MQPAPGDFHSVAIDAYRAGRFEEAASFFLECVRAAPDDWQSRFFLAMCYAQMNRTRDAKQEFLQIRDMCPDREMRAKAGSALVALTTMTLKKSS